MVDKAVLLKSLKCGNTIWEEGTVLDPPFPPEIESEIFYQTGTVRYEGDLGQSIVPLENGTTHTTYKPKRVKRVKL